MAKKFYCSVCGMEVTVIRKAIPGKGHIMDLVYPHECGGIPITQVPEGVKTALDIIEDLKPISMPVKEGSESAKSHNVYSDLRPGVNSEKSLAPKGILDAIKSSTPIG